MGLVSKMQAIIAIIAAAHKLNAVKLLAGKTMPWDDIKAVLDCLDENDRLEALKAFVDAEAPKLTQVYNGPVYNVSGGVVNISYGSGSSARAGSSTSSKAKSSKPDAGGYTVKEGVPVYLKDAWAPVLVGVTPYPFGALTLLTDEDGFSKLPRHSGTCWGGFNAANAMRHSKELFASAADGSFVSVPHTKMKQASGPEGWFAIPKAAYEAALAAGLVEAVDASPAPAAAAAAEPQAPAEAPAFEVDFSDLSGLA
jgi:hypothetical protein